MSIRFSCSKCKRVLNVPDQYAGRRSKCPGCAASLKVPGDTGGPTDTFAFAAVGQLIEAPAGATPSAPSAPSEPSARPEDFGLEPQEWANAWHSVRGGLGNMWLATAILVVVLILVALVLMLSLYSGTLFVVNTSKTQTEMKEGARNIASIIGVLILVLFSIAVLSSFMAAILRLVGCIRCLRIPSGAGAFFLTLMMLLGEFLQPLGLICLLLLLRHIGKVLACKQLPGRVTSFVIWLVIGSVVLFGALGMLLLVFFVLANPDDPKISGEMSYYLILGSFLTVAGVQLFLLIKYLNLLGVAGDEIVRRVGKARPAY